MTNNETSIMMSKVNSASDTLIKELYRQIDESKILIKEHETKWQDRLRDERVLLEEIRSNDVTKLHDKYECLMQEVRERAERAEIELAKLKKEYQA